ncbi:MAG: hypothetical protein PVJ92_00725 [Candidatus Dependentiae bacterium]|jgi:hypothetical protein
MNNKLFFFLALCSAPFCSASNDGQMLFLPMASGKQIRQLQTALPKNVVFGFSPLPQSYVAAPHGLVKLAGRRSGERVGVFEGTTTVPKRRRRAAKMRELGGRETVTRAAYEEDGPHTGKMAYILKKHRFVSGGDIVLQLKLDAEKEYKEYFHRLDKYGSLLFFAGLVAEYLLYRARKQQPDEVIKAQEHLLETIMTLPASHALRKLEWHVDDATLQRQVAYLLNQNAQGLSPKVSAALRRYHHAVAGPSLTRKVLTHGATLVGLLMTLYGGVNGHRLKKYCKDMGGNRLGIK